MVFCVQEIASPKKKKTQSCKNFKKKKINFVVSRFPFSFISTPLKTFLE